MSTGDRPSILLVDDIPQNLLALEAVLEPLGCNLVGTTSGEGALKALLKEDFALVLLDVQMPELDGFETAALIKQRERTRHIPIIFLTAVSKDSKQIFRGYSGGAVDYILKPFDPELLRSKVSVFVDLYTKSEQLKRQAELLRETELAEVRRRSEERYRQLADAMPQIVWTSDALGRTIYRNRRFYEFSGLDEGSVGGDAWVEILHPDDLEAVVAERARTVATGEIFEAQFRYRAADGSYRWHLGRSIPITSPAGRVELWVGTATDIDEQKRLYEQVEEQAQAARVLTAVADAVFLVDRKGVVRLWNPAAEAATGLKADDVRGFSIDEVLPSWTTIADRVPLSTDPKELSRHETLPLEVDGKEIWVSIAGVAVQDGTVYAFRDMTEERLLEQMRQDLVATVSHELRTPLAAIYGSAETIRRSDIELNAGLRDRLIRTIAEESARLTQIVNDLLLASNPERLDLSLEECDARVLGESVVEAARLQLPKNVTVSFQAPKTLPPVVADTQHLRQVLSNLVENAIKYSPEGGPVRISLRRQGGYVRFAVRDQGLGIPRAEQERIFEKFYRLDPEMRRGVGGTGLGLYICRALVRQLHGRIWVSSQEGKGSTFFVEIPVAPGARKRTSRRSSPRAAGTRA
jgi:PAS domain S-box-containing protein